MGHSDERLRFDTVCRQFEADLKAGKQPNVEDLLGSTSEPERSTLRRRLTAIKAELDAAGRGDLTTPSVQRGTVDQETPERIGRYRVERLLGTGGYGRVYLAHDDELNRLVAIKVVHGRQVSHPKDVDGYLAEARLVASLDHPGIVPVYDVGRTEDGLCYIVSKFIEGSDLRRRIAVYCSSPFEASALIATVAEALHYSHLRGFVHRDIKPANILLDSSGRPYIADFGLALKEEDLDRRTSMAGTPAYMSPEQAREEGCRVDGRADIFGLGVVLYELLTGHRPFVGESPTDLLHQIVTTEPRPLRQQNAGIPRELERICLKALAKRVTDRYLTAADMADDLNRFLKKARNAGTRDSRADDLTPRPPPSTPAAPLSYRRVTACISLALAVLSLAIVWRQYAVSNGSHDASSDAGSNRSNDASSDAGSNRSNDASSDAGSNRSHDASSDAGSNRSHDASSDAGSNRSHDASSDAGSNRSHDASSEVRIGRVRIDETSCSWVNQSLPGTPGDKQASLEPIGFVPLSQEDTSLQLRRVYETLRRLLGTRVNEEGLPDFSSYESFAEQFRHRFRADFPRYYSEEEADAFARLLSVWPSTFQMEELQSVDAAAYQALHDFRRAFLTTKRPIFDVVLENRGPKEVTIHSARLELRGITVQYKPRPHAMRAQRPRPIDVVARYDWSVDLRRDGDFNSWHMRNVKAANEVFLRQRGGRDTFAATYPGTIVSAYEMLPPILLPSHQATRVTIKLLSVQPMDSFSEGENIVLSLGESSSRVPLQIRFTFCHGSDSEAKSRWYRLSFQSERE